MLGCEMVKSLAGLFDPENSRWQRCVRKDADIFGVRRVLDGHPEDGLLADLEEGEKPKNWHLIYLQTDAAALLCRVGKRK